MLLCKTDTFLFSFKRPYLSSLYVKFISTFLSINVSIFKTMNSSVNISPGKVPVGQLTFGFNCQQPEILLVTRGVHIATIWSRRMWCCTVHIMRQENSFHEHYQIIYILYAYFLFWKSPSLPWYLDFKTGDRCSPWSTISKSVSVSPRVLPSVQQQHSHALPVT